MYGKTKRGLGLTTFLVLMLIVNLFAFVFYFFINNLSKLDLDNITLMNTTTLIIYLIATIVNTVGIIATWFSKAWGVYLTLLTYVIIILVNAMDNFSITFIGISILVICLFVYLSKNIWKAEM